MTPKEKRFISILAGITVVCVGGLYFFASKGSSRFDAAKQQFDAVDSEIKSMEGLPVYPTEKNLALKEAELKTYSANAEELSKKLQALRPANLENTDPQAFTDLLVKTADASIKAYQTAGLSSEGDNPSLPKGFYLGFEAYTSTPAQKDSTGIMTYQLGAISELNAVLAASKPSALLNFRREALPEEKNEAYKPTPGVPYRALPIEVAFAGPESALRAFINGIQSSKQHYFVIRSMRVRKISKRGRRPPMPNLKLRPQKVLMPTLQVVVFLILALHLSCQVKVHPLLLQKPLPHLLLLPSPRKQKTRPPIAVAFCNKCSVKKISTPSSASISYCLTVLPPPLLLRNNFHSNPIHFSHEEKF